MLLVIVLTVSCKKIDEKSESSPAKEDDELMFGSHYVEYDENDTLKKYYFASIYALLSNPKFFDKKTVQTCGYLSGDISGENCSIQWTLFPSKEDALHNMFTNALRIEKIEEETEIFRHMELPYGIYTCFMGTFSSNIYGMLIKIGFTNVTMFGLNFREVRWSLSDLNKKLDSLLKEGEDISEFRWSCPCSSFEIQKGKIRSVDTSPDCPTGNYYDRIACIDKNIVENSNEVTIFSRNPHKVPSVPSAEECWPY
jgi:hypothetical protein